MQRHAYLIMAHQDRHHLEQLLSLLDDERNDVYLLIDSKGSLHTDGLTLRRSRLEILPSIPIYYAGYSQIQGVLLLLKAACVHEYRYYHLLTGADLPLVDQNRVHALLDESELEYIDVEPVNKTFAHFKAGYYHFFIENRLYTKYVALRGLRHVLVKLQAAIGIDRARKGNIDFYHGSAFFSITHGFARYVLDRERWIRATFHHVLSGDEVYLQTMIMDSPFCSRCAPRGSLVMGNLRYIDWGRRVRNSPYTFRIADLEELKSASSQYLFARKFSRAVDGAIVDTIVSRIRDTGRL